MRFAGRKTQKFGRMAREWPSSRRETENVPTKPGASLFVLDALSMDIYIYINIHMFIYIYICIYMYMYIYIYCVFNGGSALRVCPLCTCKRIHLETCLQTEWGPGPCRVVAGVPGPALSAMLEGETPNVLFLESPLTEPQKRNCDGEKVTRAALSARPVYEVLFPWRRRSRTRSFCKASYLSRPRQTLPEFPDPQMLFIGCITTLFPEIRVSFFQSPLSFFMFALSWTIRYIDLIYVP